MIENKLVAEGKLLKGDKILIKGKLLLEVLMEILLEVLIEALLEALLEVLLEVLLKALLEVLLEVLLRTLSISKFSQKCFTFSNARAIIFMYGI